MNQTATIEPANKYRVHSIDILRGLVMIVMALDHTRDFFHQSAMTADPLNVDTTFPWLYFTRWITHYCAPTFVFLSGVSAYLAASRRSRKDGALFLIKRGLWLVLVEVTIVTFGITFNPEFNFIILQVIWAIGWSMFFLGVVSWISPKLVLILGLLLFFGHNIFDSVALPDKGTTGVLSTLLFRASGSILFLDNNHIIGAFYAILPWTGAMFLGYSIGRWYQNDFPAAKRRRLLLLLGFGLIVLFIVLRATNLYGNPFPFEQQEDGTRTVLAFLNTNKYPPSLLFLSMTLGPACILLSLFESARGRWASIVSVYGKVPFFYYVLHFYLIHLLGVIFFFATGHTTDQIADPNLPFLFRPLTFGYGLPTVYIIWLSVVAALYLPCKWFARYKQTHRQWWLSYI